MASTPKQRDSVAQATPYTERELAALERGNHGPQKKVIARLIESIRQAREESEERGWRLTELETQVEREKQERDDVARRSTARVLLVVACDGFTEVYADQTVSVKVVNLYPWDDPHELMLNEKSHWSEIWSPGKVRTTVLPNYVKAPNVVTADEMVGVLKWYETKRVGEVVADLRRIVDEQERQAIRQLGLKVFDMRHIDEHGMRNTMTEVLQDVDEDTHIHVSFDLDCLDPADAPGVGTAVRGGPTYREMQLCMEMVADTGRMASLDVVEINPALDMRNRTAEVAVDFIRSLFGASTLAR